jgi:hypothetical protein
MVYRKFNFRKNETLTVVLTVAASFAIGINVIVDTAKITAINEYDTDQSNNSEIEAASVSNEGDLQVTKVESIDPVIAGSGLRNLNYVLKVQLFPRNFSQTLGLFSFLVFFTAE